MIIAFLPETARLVVGNGSIPSKGFLSRDLVSQITQMRIETSCRQDLEHIASEPSKKTRIINPLSCISVILYKDTASILVVNALHYMIYCCIQASLSSSFISIYHFQELEAGLIYLPFGLGCAIASYASGLFYLFIMIALQSDYASICILRRLCR